MPGKLERRVARKVSVLGIGGRLKFETERRRGASHTIQDDTELLFEVFLHFRS